MGRSGLEPGDTTGGNSKSLGDSGKSGGAGCGAESAENAPTGPDLAKVIRAWPKLPEPIKAAILAMVKTSTRPKGNSARKRKE